MTIPIHLGIDRAGERWHVRLRASALAQVVKIDTHPAPRITADASSGRPRIDGWFVPSHP
jgi:hypothetical protein